ncbi:TolC family protein [Flavobacterium sp. UBA4854]|uniref:TolC family protein n=1 Tax=Flavobacterium sp. UBA4854 TaxID=1946548 RepID=UPI00257976CA|nr:TolC family protein [Flavobacterium sp. UBA4854]
MGAGVVLAPGINLGANKISTVGVAGLSVGWDIKGLYKNSNEKQLTQQELKKIEVQEETFLFNTRFQMNQKTADIERQKAILKDDDDIVKLRQIIREGYQLKYDTGVGPLIDLLNSVEKEGNARAEKAMHEIQLLMSEYEYQTIKGN